MEKNWIVAWSVFEMTLFNPLPLINDQKEISPYNIKHISDDNKVKHQLGDY